MQNNAADKLHIVVDHFPLYCRPSGLPLLADMTAAGLLDDGKGLGQDLVENLLGVCIDRLLQIGNLLVGGIALVGIDILLQQRVQLGDARLVLGDMLVDACAELDGLATKLFIGERGILLVKLVDLLDDRAQKLDVLLTFGSEELF